MGISLEAWKRWDWDGWTGWQRLVPKTIATVAPGPGAYLIGLPTRRGIGRLLARDPHALLDIGESSRLRRRLEAFVRCADEEGQRGHMAGWRLGSMGLMNALGYEPTDLRVSWCPAATKKAAYAIEGEILHAYFQLFGELPPLNYKFNWSAFE